MKKLFFLLSVFIFTDLFSQSFNQKKMDALFDRLEEKDKVMASVSIWKGNHEIYKRSIGFENIEKEIKASDQTKYHIGSISKTFTAYIILKLIEEEKLSLKTKLSEYFPDFTNADSISVWHMLKHQSGLFNFTNSPAYLKWCKTEKSRQELIDYMRVMGTTSRPGDRFEYSNTNYVLLSLIAEEIEEKSFTEIFDERVVKVLQLKSTYYGGILGSQPNEALSYRKLGVWNQTEITHPTVPLGAGGVVSTPYDLNVFFNALFTKKILSEDQLHQMTDTSGKYGLGIFASPFHERTALGHTGGIDGFSNTADFIGSDSVYIAYCANASDVLMNDVMIGILSITFDRDYKISTYEPEYKVSRDKLDAYKGEYYCKEIGMTIVVDRIEDQLTAQATNQPAFPLNVYDKHKFQFKQAGVKMEFFPKENRMELDQGGLFKFERKAN